jgi:S-DNA-T family DNA segregation ATPase FtsK/SpoIIIE
VEALALVSAVTAAPPAAVAVTSVTRYALSDSERRAVLRKAWRIRATWRRTAIRVGLFQAEHGAKVGAEVPLVEELRAHRTEKILIPRIKVTPIPGGVMIDVRTIGKLGLDAFEKACDDLANAWRAKFVTVTPGKPGHLRLRVTLKDALRTKTTYTPSVDDAVDLRAWELGHDRYGAAVRIRTSDVSGIVVGGLSGTGKTALVRHRFAKLAPSPFVQFALIDGKGYELEDLAPRAWEYAGASVPDAHRVVTKLYELFTTRQAEIRSVLKRKNFWAGAPIAAWPFTVMIMDEAHTFLFESKLKDDASVKRDKLVREIVRMCDDMVRQGRALGIQLMFLTQKPTGEAIPTAIRDNCQIAMSYAQRSTEAAKAALGEDIADYPHAHPRRLQDPAYIGVLTVLAEGRSGYTLVRNPFTSDADAIALAEATAHLVADPLALIEYAIRGLHAVKDDATQAA